jgi:hypothetical protein
MNLKKVIQEQRISYTGGPLCSVAVLGIFLHKNEYTVFQGYFHSNSYFRQKSTHPSAQPLDAHGIAGLNNIH